MPKEGFHIYLADRLARECVVRRPILLDMPAFLIGAISPDIFYYDLPFFSVSPLGDWFHSLIERDGVSIIYEWVSRRPFEKANAEEISWGLGVACHFMADALFHPLIEELSGEGLGTVFSSARSLSPIDRHRLIESEIEAFWLESSPQGQKKNCLRSGFRGKRGRLLKIASYYLSLFEFAGGASPASPAPVFRPSRIRISWCFLCQDLLLRLFANRTLGARRDKLLAFSPTRILGALVTPVRPVLPALFARAMDENRDPFSDSFMNGALSSLKADWCALLDRLTGEKENTR